MTRVSLGVDVFTTGQIGKICGVAPRTVSKWFDTGKLKGYRIPGSQDRRVSREELVTFMRVHSLPTDALPGGQSGGGRVLAIGLSDDQADEVVRLAINGYPVAVDNAEDEFDAWVKFCEMPSEVVAVASAKVNATRLAQLVTRMKASGTGAYVVGIGCEYDTAEDTAKLSDVCDVLVPFPHTAKQIAAAVGEWRKRPTLPKRVAGNKRGRPTKAAQTEAQTL